MTKLNAFFRKIINKRNIKKLKNTNFSLIASNCNGGFICHDLNLQFKSPFINLWLKPNDFIKYLQNIKHYMTQELKFVSEDGINYPIGLLDDIKIYFQHYKTEETAREKWNERTKRIDLNNIFILFTDRDNCTYQNLLDFDELPFKNKVVFTHKQYPEIKSAFYIKGFEKESSVGDCFKFKNNFSGKKIYDQFDYINWFNQIL